MYRHHNKGGLKMGYGYVSEHHINTELKIIYVVTLPCETAEKAPEELEKATNKMLHSMNNNIRKLYLKETIIPKRIKFLLSKNMSAKFAATFMETMCYYTICEPMLIAGIIFIGMK